MQKLISDEEIAEALKTYAGIEEATAEDWLMDALEVLPMMMGMPMGMSKIPIPMKKTSSGRYVPFPKQKSLEGGLEKLQDIFTDIANKPGPGYTTLPAQAPTKRRRILKKILESEYKLEEKLDELLYFQGIEESLRKGEELFPWQKEGLTPENLKPVHLMLRSK